jgi:DNA repair protein RadD
VAHSMALRDEFRKAGIPAEHVDADTEGGERGEMFARLASGETLVVCNCNIARYGVDVPQAECCQIVTPMTSVVDFRQSVGRVLRSCPGKTRAVVIDHAGAVLYHGLPHADLPWTLDVDTDHVELQKKRMEDGEAPKPVACHECHTLFSGTRKCPGCGWEPKRAAKNQATKAGTLTKVEDVTREFTGADLQRIWARKVGVCVNKGLPLSQAAGMFKSEAGRAPWDCGVLLDRLPEAGSHLWRRPAYEAYPDFCRKKAA